MGKIYKQDAFIEACNDKKKLEIEYDMTNEDPEGFFEKIVKILIIETKHYTH